MKLTFQDYIRAAFNARPIGMLVPPNWIGLMAFFLLGVLNPGFWLMGAGLELAYLYALSTSRRFQSVVQGGKLSQQRRQWQSQLKSQITRLIPPDQEKYRALERRCQSILQQQRGPETPTPDSVGRLDLTAQSEGLGRLLWIFLRLLLTRQSLVRVMHDSAQSQAQKEPMEDRIRGLEEQIKQKSIGEELRKSLTSQLEILQQRLAKQQEAHDKLAYLDAELTRIQEQVELIREQAVLSTDPEVVSQRIDQITATLGGTTQWIQQQQQLYGKVEDLLAEPPPISLQTPAEESQ